MSGDRVRYLLSGYYREGYSHDIGWDIRVYDDAAEAEAEDARLTALLDGAKPLIRQAFEKWLKGVPGPCYGGHNPEVWKPRSDAYTAEATAIIDALGLPLASDMTPAELVPWYGDWHICFEVSPVPGPASRDLVY